MTAPTPLPPPPAWHTLPDAPAIGTVLLHRDALQDGQVLLHSVAANADQPQAKPFNLLLLRSGDQVTAFANRCAHFGVPLAARQEHMIFESHTSLTCNVHYARFRWSDGVCDRGDCEGDALTPVPLHVDADGQVRVGPSS